MTEDPKADTNPPLYRFDFHPDLKSEPSNSTSASFNESPPVAGSPDDLFTSGVNTLGKDFVDRSKEKDDTPEGITRASEPRGPAKIIDQKSSQDVGGNSASRLSNN